MKVLILLLEELDVCRQLRGPLKLHWRLPTMRIAVMGLCGVLHTRMSHYLNRFSSMFLFIKIIEANSVVEIPVVCSELCKMAHWQPTSLLVAVSGWCTITVKNLDQVVAGFRFFPPSVSQGKLKRFHWWCFFWLVFVFVVVFICFCFFVVVSVVVVLLLLLCCCFVVVVVFVFV